VGSLSAVSTQIIDFHTSGNNIDYDSRIVAYGGSTTIGTGYMELIATSVNIPLLNLTTPYLLLVVVLVQIQQQEHVQT
jgi:hypothetical protein